MTRTYTLHATGPTHTTHVPAPPTPAGRTQLAAPRTLTHHTPHTAADTGRKVYITA